MGRKMCAGAVWLAALILYFFENNTGTRAVLLISLLVPLFSILCARAAANRQAVTLSVPETARTGGRIRCRIRTPVSGWTAGCSVVFTVTGRNRLTGESFETELPAAHGGETVFEAESRHCGCLELRVTRAAVQDWFALTRQIREIRTEASVLILPELYPVSVRTDADPGECSREAGGSRRKAEEPEPGDLRPYIPGDSIRRIHWKLSEKANQTLVRDSSPEALNYTALLLETATEGKSEPEAVHDAVRGLLSVSGELAARDIAHAVGWAEYDRAVLADVENEADFQRMQERILSAGTADGSGSIGTLFTQQYPDLRFRRVIVYSPYPDTNVSLLAERQPVTLTLPKYAVFSGSEAGVRVALLDPADAAVEI